MRSIFVEHILKSDQAQIREIPINSQYASQIEIYDKLNRYVRGREQDLPEIAPKPVVLSGKVDWFDPAKGYGFIKVPSNPNGVYIGSKALKVFGRDELSAGDNVRFSAVETQRGMSVTEILHVDEGKEALERISLEVVRVFWDRSYGFARFSGSEKNVFFHFSVIPPRMLAMIHPGHIMLADVYHDESDGSYEVRRVAETDE